MNPTPTAHCVSSLWDKLDTQCEKYQPEHSS